MPIAENDPRVQRVAVAHLVGNNIDYLMKKYEITLGRKAKNYSPDVIMGETMSVSREHAKIIYNFETHQFELIVLGRNGVMVNGFSYEPECGPIPLKSKALLQIGNASFYFLLPKKLSKLFTSSETETTGKSASGNVFKLKIAGNGVEASLASAEAAGAGPSATTTTQPSGAMPTQQQMIRLIQETAARQQRQQAIAATLTAQHQQQQALSPAQRMLLVQQLQQLAGADGGGGGTVSPQQLQYIQMQLLLQQQQLINEQQQQKSPPPK